MADAIARIIDETVTVKIEGADLIAPLVADAQAAATAAGASAASAASSALQMQQARAATYGLTLGPAGGAVWDLRYWETDWFQDAAGTLPFTTSGQPVGCIRNALGDPSWDLVQTDATKRPVGQIIDGRPRIFCDIGKGLKTRVDKNARVPSYIMAGLKSGADMGTTAFGFIASPFGYFALGINTLLRRIQTTFRYSSDWVTALADYYTLPYDSVAVADGLLTASQVFARVNAGTNTIGESPLAHTQAVGTEIPSCIFALNYSTSLAPSTTSSVTFYGGAALIGEDEQQDGLVDYVRDEVTPAIRPQDKVILVVGDSTGDDVVTATGSMGDELFLSWARNVLPGLEPTRTIYYRNFNPYTDDFTGWQRLANGTGTGRVFVSNMSISGSQPDYTLGDRFPRFVVGGHPHVDEVFINHGHNMPILPSEDPGAYVYRGDWIELFDELRRAFPNAPHLAIRTHPIRTSDNVLRAVQALDAVAAMYGDIKLADIYSHYEAQVPPRPSAWYANDNLHPSVPLGVEAGQRPPFDAAYSSWARPALVAGPLIGHTTTSLTTNPRFDDYDAAVPAGWMTFGSVSVSRSGAIVDAEEGDIYAVRLSTTAGPGGIQQTFDVTAHQGSQIAVLVREYSQAGGSGTVGQITLTSNGAGAITATSQHNGHATGRFRNRVLILPIPGNATTATVKLYAAAGGAGVSFVGRVVAVGGLRPKNLR